MSPIPPSPDAPIDRNAHAARPRRFAVMRQDWEHLLFLHWEVPAESLRRLLPGGLELDLYEGKAYVGLVAFTMSGVRPVGVPPLPWLSRFHETNIRTYVHAGGQVPGVWFFSLDAANPLAVVAARASFHLPYHWSRMSVDVDAEGEGALAYASERRWPGPLPATATIRARHDGSPTRAIPGTLAHFLIERYVLYASRRGRLSWGQVHHAPYPVESAEALEIEETLIARVGIAPPSASPLCHYARRVRTEIFPLRKVDWLPS